MNILIERYGTKLGKKIHSQINTNSKNYNNPQQYIYDKVGELIVCNLNDYQKVIDNDNYMYQPYYNKRDIEIDRQVNPPEVKEGGYKCKCGSEQTYSYQLQTRSADEPMTTFITCAKCSKRWKE